MASTRFWLTDRIASPFRPVKILQINEIFRLQQFTQNENGYYYSYNISLCGVNPYPCSYSSDSAGALNNTIFRINYFNI
jgi:hypothetical protein